VAQQEGEDAAAEGVLQQGRINRGHGDEGVIGPYEPFGRERVENTWGTWVGQVTFDCTTTADCDDQNNCTFDLCHPLIGSCIHVCDVGKVCGQFCGVDLTCQAATEDCTCSLP
jgi:hypothetical protein